MARKILLADDSVTAQNMGRKILADAGYEVITVNNGSAALKKVAEAKPDLIVLDVYMPGYSGLEVCQRLKDSQETARMPVLLTVGKLEPFKPEEAKRVRAEAFIVKPFEASELLSALSRLEDKIVPRAESSKPGRFARAIAAVEESDRYGTNEVDDKSGWKRRIAFPTKKKKKAEEEDGDDPAIYNAVNRDLRTVIEHEPAHEEKKEAAPPDDHVDVAGLGVPGLPRDVSPEEIAAIAAAAAQVQVATEAHEAVETEESGESKSTAEMEAVRAFEDASAQQTAGNEKVQAQAGTAADTATPLSAGTSSASADAPSAATLAEKTGDETGAHDVKDDLENRRGDRSETSGSDPANAAAIAAIAALEPANGQSWADNPPFGTGHPAQEIPVTMAVGPTGPDGSETRWMAVPMAIDPDEAAISLELEMEKAYAAFAAAEANLPGFISPTPEAPAAKEEAVAPLPEATAPLPGPCQLLPNASAEQESVAAACEPELRDSMNAVANASAEALGGAVTELAAVAASHLDAANEVLAEEHSVGSRAVEGTSESANNTGAEIATGQDSGTSHVDTERPGEVTAAAMPPLPDKAAEEPVAREIAAPEPIVGGTTAAHESAIGGVGDMAEKRESELAASTAAAWASWRQIRETAHPADDRNPSESELDESSNTAAMAAAAGAERAPDEASGENGEDPAAIASIVDSVLADLRPKIVEEISRKLGKKKK